VAELQEAIRWRPEHPVSHYCLGVAWRRLGQEVRAQEALEEAVRLAPQMVEAHYQLGESYVRAGEIARGKEHLAAALAGQPGHLAARTAWAVAEGLEGGEKRKT
jgi:cytochrome c-type biogenesis protein CcmH/NrfG